MDPITALRTEWISAALCTNQTPRTADVALQLGTYDGRVVNFLPRTVRKLITSSLESDGALPVSCERMLRQMKERRFGDPNDMQGGMDLELLVQRADDLSEVKDESIDVVVSLQSVEKMIEKGIDWKESVKEAIRVLKPGTGRFLFVERTDTGYLPYLEEFEDLGIFEEIGYDDVDLILTPHVAGVAVKSEDAGLTEEEKAEKRRRREQEMYADRSIQAFERGNKRRRRKKKKKGEVEEGVEEKK